jgi:NADH:ubiquinone oxidoreductase subunit 2 (subunit N)
VAMTVFLFSLAGVPPFAGWAAKLFVFRAAINAAGADVPAAAWLAAIMAINTVVALFYYAAVVRQMFFEAPAEDRPTEITPLLRTALLVPAVVILVVGIIPEFFGSIARASSLI